MPDFEEDRHATQDGSAPQAIGATEPGTAQAVPLGLAGRYWIASRAPRYVLLVVAPLTLLYVALTSFAPETTLSDQRAAAEWLLHRGLAWIGLDSPFMPSAALLIALWLWQRRAPHVGPFEPTFLPVMLAEAFVLMLPLFVVAQVVTLVDEPAALMAAGETSLALGQVSIRMALQTALAAGLFEEALFRWLPLGLVSVGALSRPARQRTLLLVATILIASIAFALVHFAPITPRPISAVAFAHFMLAGVYFGLIFLARGLGIAVLSHVAYDLVLLLGSR